MFKNRVTNIGKYTLKVSADAPDFRDWQCQPYACNASRCNSDAVGTRVWLTFPVDTGRPQQYREVTSANGFSAQGDRRVLFGLGNYDGPVSVDIQWCGMDRDTIASPQLNRYHRISQKARG